MKQRTAILIAMALTTFVVIAAAAIALTVTSKSVAQTAAPSKPRLDEQSVSGHVGQVQAIAPTSTWQPTVLPLPTQPSVVSKERATRLALQVMPGSKLQQPPELVNYKGKMAYEVLLSSGAVYVDAFNGKILGSVLTVASSPPPMDIPSDNGGGNNGAQDSTNNNPPPSDLGVTNDAAVQNQPAVSQYDHHSGSGGGEDDDKAVSDDHHRGKGGGEEDEHKETHEDDHHKDDHGDDD